MDLLSQVLGESRLSSATFRSFVLRGEWRLRFDGGLRGVHVVVSGHPHLTLADGTGVALGPGDLVVLPRPDSHTMASSPGTRRTPYSSRRLAEQTPDVEVAFGTDGAETRIVCGAFFFADEEHPAVAGLPRLVHVPAGAVHADWLRGLSEAVVAEARHRGPGSDVVLARISDALVVRALRYHLETADDAGWLQALRDPAIARSLAAVHRDLARPWTVALLAREARLSRTVFAARFTTLVGRSPMSYVTDCRMRRAQALLRNDRLTVSAVAARVGYGSESALSAAFTRYAGTTPGAYRRGSEQGQGGHGDGHGGHGPGQPEVDARRWSRRPRGDRRLDAPPA